VKIYLVRHGEKEVRINENNDPALTEEGKRQIILLARRLKHNKLKISKIHSTGHLRSIQTAEILSKSLYLPVFKDDNLVELEKELFDDITKDNGKFHEVKLFLERIVNNKEDVLLAMHGGINRAIISCLLGFSLRDTRRLAMNHASLSLLELVELKGVSEWKLRFLNDTTHLIVP
jgi:broad specificity phosphatase PhoE